MSILSFIEDNKRNERGGEFSRKLKIFQNFCISSFSIPPPSQKRFVNRLPNRGGLSYGIVFPKKFLLHLGPSSELFS